MGYQSLLSPDKIVDVSELKKKKGKPAFRGCDYCPRNNVKGIKKVKGTVEGKKIFIWVQSPGPNENIEGKELVGRAGQWLWMQLKAVGITRKDCDIQNVVRCFPADYSHTLNRFVMRDPTKEEIFCCSLYTDQAIVKSKAQVHLVFGRIAAEALFGKKKEKLSRTFWSDKLNGRVFLFDHPSYFIRGTATHSKIVDFKNTLLLVKKFLSRPPGRFGYLETQDYKGIVTIKAAKLEAKRIRRKAKSRRIVFDLEEGNLGGEQIALCAGFSYRPGRARCFLLEHMTGVQVGSKVRRGIRKVVVGLLSDPNIRYSMHHGSYDVPAVRRLLNTRIGNYDFDTNFSEYLAYPGRRSYKLSEVAEVRFPDFVDHKKIIEPYIVPEGMTLAEASKRGKLNLAWVPWEKMILYNCADADLEKRVEVSTKDKINLPLLHIYRDAQFTMERMEPNGPFFDYKQEKKLEQIYPVKVKRLTNQLQVMARDPNFNPGSPPQVAKILYDKLKAPILDKHQKRTTDKRTLELLENKYPFAKVLNEFRRAKKIESTYLASFKRSADTFNGRLRTIWWLTGTITGRGSSGAGKDKDKNNPLVNLQNIHGDVHLQNMVVSDINWRDVYEAWKNPDKSKNWWKEFEDYHVLLSLDGAQMEIRQLAQETMDPEYIKIFKEDGDIHSEVGHAMTGWPIKVIVENKQKRKLVKNFHFGLIYGCEDESMVDYLKAKGVDKSLATLPKVQEFSRGYFKRFKKVKLFIDAKRKEVKRTGGVTNIFGFRVPINVEGEKGGGFWANQAINFPIQGGAHQILTMALALLTRKPQTYKKIRTPQMEIHDALVFRVKLRDLFDMMRLAKRLLEHDVLRVIKNQFGIDWQIPLKAEANAGFRLGTQVEVKDGMTVEMFLNNWCKKNREITIELQKELRAVAA